MSAEVLRNACDACHKNKARCISSGGPCENCRLRGSSCQFSQRNKMGRPRIRPDSSARTTKRQRMRRESTAQSSTLSESDYAKPTSPEIQSLSSDDLDQLPPVQCWHLSPFEPNGSSLIASSSASSATPSWTPQSNISDQFNTNSNCQPDLSPSSYSFGPASLVDQVQLADLLTTQGISSTSPAGDCVWTPENQLPTSSSFDQPNHLISQNQTSAHLQLPQILFKLRTISQGLKSCASSEVQRDQIIATISSLCDITRSSKTCWNSNGQLPSPDLIILATTVSVAVEIYSVLAEELSSDCSSWVDHERPGTDAFLKFHAKAFAMNLHLVELREALNMAGVAAYDACTAQATDHVHTAVKGLLRRWQTY